MAKSLCYLRSGVILVNVIVYLRLSAWGDSVTKGNVLELDDSWLKLEGKKDIAEGKFRFP